MITREKRALVILLLAALLGSAQALHPPETASASTLPVLLGLYPWGSFQEAVTQIQGLDAWSGKGNSIAATFMDLDDPDVATNLAPELDTAWSAGYTPFINLAPRYPLPAGAGAARPSPRASGRSVAGGPECSGITAADIGNGSLDTAIAAWAEAFKAWALSDPTKRAFIAPLQEMNGFWVCYGLDPDGFRLAFVRIRHIFADRGVPSGSVSWVFAPNGYSHVGDPPLEDYYPGNTFVDIASFSAYNWGGCSPYAGDTWKTPQELLGEYLTRMRSLAPGKPIFLAEVATSSVPRDGEPDFALKDAWLAAAYSYFPTNTALRGVLYFNVYEESRAPAPFDCDFPLYDPPDVFPYGPPDQVGFESFRTAVSGPAYAYVSPADMGALAFEPRPGVFEDVWPVHPFAGVSDVYYQRWVEALAASGITSGCRIEQIPLPGLTATEQLRYYCPEAVVTRAQMAIFLERGMHGVGFSPDAATGTVFGDVPADHWAGAWIELLAADGITGGCSVSPPLYCPDSPVTRAQMAIFLERAKNWPGGVTPPPATGTVFDDVPADHWAGAWIEQLAADGITGGCSALPPLYCPDSPVTRGQMAVFLVRSFQLPLP